VRSSLNVGSSRIHTTRSKISQAEGNSIRSQYCSVFRPVIKRPFSSNTLGDEKLDKWAKIAGSFTRENGEKYEGELVFGVPQGKGSYTWSDRKYEGEWKAGAPWGKGKMESLKSVEKSEGIFERGRLILGRVTNGNETKLEGRFKSNGLEWGKRIHSDGSIDEGDFISHNFTKTNKAGTRFQVINVNDPPRKFVEDWSLQDVESWAKRLAPGFEYLFHSTQTDGKQLMQLSGEQLDYFNEVAAIYGVEKAITEKQELGKQEIQNLQSFRDSLKQQLDLLELTLK